MQQHKHFWNTKRSMSQRASVLVLLGAPVLLAILVAAGWGSARAAPQSGGSSLSIVSIDGNTLTLQFDNWTPGQTITLSYSANQDCRASLPLPNNTISATASAFQAHYTWPSSGIQPGDYHLCATDPMDGIISSMQTITVTDTGGVQPTPTIPGSTPTSASGSPTPSPTVSGGSASATPGNGPGATSTPGSQGASATPPNNNSGGNTLVAIILLCLLVLALLVYLLRLWLQGRQPGGQPPAGGGQP